VLFVICSVQVEHNVTVSAGTTFCSLKKYYSSLYRKFINSNEAKNGGQNGGLIVVVVKCNLQSIVHFINLLVIFETMYCHIVKAFM